MNYYWLFYLISIIGNLSVAIGWIAAAFTGISIFYWITSAIEEDKTYPVEKVIQSCKKSRKIFFILSIIGWIIFSLIPTKKDSLFILAAGTVGNFMTQDSSAKRIPSEIATYLSTELQKQIKENLGTKKIEDMTKEELIEQLKSK